MSDHDFRFETQPGLPAPLPEGETLLWQGNPDAHALARDAFKANWVLGYLLLIAVWRSGAAWADATLARGIAVFLPYLVLAVAAYGLVHLLARASARATVYSITSRRVILRIGAALPVTWTVPFTRVASAGVAQRPDGTGTIALQLTDGSRISWLSLWPHVRPGLGHGIQPALRCIPDATRAARILADAAQTSLNEPVLTHSPALAADPIAAE